MKKSNFNKIMLVSLCDKWTGDVAFVLAQNLDMLYCDVADLMEYDLSEKKVMEEVCSKEYVEKREKGVVRRYLSFENVVCSVDCDILIQNKEFMDKSNLIVFLNVPHDFVEKNATAINSIASDSRRKKLKEMSDICINIRKTDSDFVCEKIIENIKDYL